MVHIRRVDMEEDGDSVLGGIARDLRIIGALIPAHIEIIGLNQHAS